MAFTDPIPTDVLILTKALSAADAESIALKVETQPPRMLLSALNVDGFERSYPGHYDILQTGPVASQRQRPS